ncbi:hypothetical protein SAMN05216371_8013 [Streptomyces sp. TLI_053]|uniref:hypothetical protein n=1 Tax=Streptomyces sp. TLI_053 TaxID=1855352 RepID=UPI00087C9C43|nr:hypothetical protein [Streptomyces sp. TLI_053]SDT83199.1 hypothetical protein SAMN05216371_8013 [Streptomyces sp. TLI_053]
MSVSTMRRRVATTCLVLVVGFVPLASATTSAHAATTPRAATPRAATPPCPNNPLEGLLLSLIPIGGLVSDIPCIG